jgi:hypothetical protein
LGGPQFDLGVRAAIRRHDKHAPQRVITRCTALRWCERQIDMQGMVPKIVNKVEAQTRNPPVGYDPGVRRKFHGAGENRLGAFQKGGFARLESKIEIRKTAADGGVKDRRYDIVGLDRIRFQPGGQRLVAMRFLPQPVARLKTQRVEITKNEADERDLGRRGIRASFAPTST